MPNKTSCESDSKRLVLCSGGLDSSTLLALIIEKYGANNVIALNIRYGQKHSREIKSSQDICSYYNVSLQIIDLTDIFKDSSSSLLSHSKKSIPHSSYLHQTSNMNDSFISTYVPFRNGLFLSVAASIALSKGCSEIYYGAHKDDWVGHVYPDCSLAFVNAMSDAIKEGTDNKLALKAPFVMLTKAEIVKKGLLVNVPYELTWSCYEGKEKPCGKCATCLDRKKAFERNGEIDPLLI